MSTRLKLFLSILFLLEILFSYNISYAQTTPVYSGPQAGITQYLCTPTGAGATDLYGCINKLYRFAIVVCAVVGMFFIVIAGYVYMNAGGNQESVDKAKNMFTSTITAIVILFAGYILLRAINPDLIEFNSIQPPNAPAVALNTPPPTSGGGGGTSGLASKSFGLPTAAGCVYGSTCVNASSLTPTHDCSSNNGQCLLSPQALQSAQTFVSSFNQQAGSTGCTLKLSSTIQVNPITSVSTCHHVGSSDTGTCADFNLLPNHDSCVQFFDNAAQSSGALVSYLDEYVQAVASTEGGNIHVIFAQH